MNRLRALVAFVLGNFGPLLAFWVIYQRWGVLTAIATSMAVAVAETAYRLLRRRPITRLFLMNVALTLGFGLVDLVLRKSVVFRFEAVLTNLIAAAYFTASLAGSRSILLELHESTRDPAEPVRPEVPAYLRLLTGVWVAYFVVKAALYAYLALALPLDGALIVRSVVGPVSFFALLFGERLVRKPLYRALRDRGIIRAEGPVPAPPSTPAPAV